LASESGTLPLVEKRRRFSFFPRIHFSHLIEARSLFSFGEFATWKVFRSVPPLPSSRKDRGSSPLFPGPIFLVVVYSFFPCSTFPFYFNRRRSSPPEYATPHPSARPPHSPFFPAVSFLCADARSSPPLFTYSSSYRMPFFLRILSPPS